MGMANSRISQETGDALRGPAYTLHGVKPNGANQGANTENCLCVTTTNFYHSSELCTLIPILLTKIHRS